MTALAAHLPLASGGSFLITPNVGLMVWTLVVFLISFFVLRKWVYPRDRRGARRPREPDQRIDRRR